jgi:uncharacterized protein YoxC
MSWLSNVTGFSTVSGQLKEINEKLDVIMTQGDEVLAVSQQIEADVALIGPSLATINTSLADLVAKVNSGGTVTAADLAALQQGVADLNTATGNVQATAATATTDDPGPSA